MTLVLCVFFAGRCFQAFAPLGFFGLLVVRRRSPQQLISRHESSGKHPRELAPPILPELVALALARRVRVKVRWLR